MQKQDLNGYRTPLDVARRYRLGDIELNTLEIEELASKIVTDSALSTTSVNPVQNKVVTSALNNKASIAALQNKQDKLIAGDNITIVDNVISSTGGGGGGTDKVGSIKLWSGTTAPNGYLLCDGTAVSRTTYADLFSIIGTTYGSGDGSTTFNLPNLKGKVVVGLDSSDTAFDTLGETGGSKTNKLSLENYAYQVWNSNQSYSNNDLSQMWGTSGNTYGLGLNYSSNKNEPVNNLQPYIVLNYIIKATTETPTSAIVEDSLTSNSTVNAPSVHSINELTTYSTSEKIVGKWIDGKPIYRKVISGTLSNSTGWDFTFASISNVSEIIHLYGTEEGKRPIPYYENNYEILVDYDSGYIRVFQASTAFFNQPINIILEYTKTTD